jgi:uncharacterized membrane protein
LRRSIQIFAGLSIVAKALIDILSGNGYVAAVVVAVLLPCALLANRFQLSESRNLRAIARFFWSLLAGSAWTVFAMAILLFVAKQIWGAELSTVRLWGRYVMAAVFPLSVALFYWMLLAQERKAGENFLLDVE